MRKFLLALAVAVVALLADVQVVSAQGGNGFSEDFNSLTEGIPTGWNNAEGSTAYETYKWNCHSDGRTGNCLRFNSYNNYNGNDNYLKTPAVDMSQGSWKLTFWYKNPNGGDFKVYLSPDGGTTRTIIADTMTSVANWTKREVSLTAAANGSSNAVILFYAVSNYGSGDAYVYIDDVVVEEVLPCKTPTGLNVLNLTTTTASVNWDLSDGLDIPNYYSYTLRTASGTVVESNPSLAAPADFTINFTNLTANTTYVLELRGDCNQQGSGLSNVATVTFTTLCNAQPAPYVNNLDGIALPECTFSSNVTVTSGGRSGNALMMTTTTADAAYIIFPELTLSSNNVEATLWLKTASVSAGNTQVKIGIVTDPSDMAGSFEPLYDGFLTTTGWTEIRMNTMQTALPVTPTTMIAINLPANIANTTLIDDVSIHQIPSCIRPEGFALSNITSSSVDLSWTATTSNVRVQIATATDTTYRLATTNPYTVTNLQPNTEYTFRIWAVCSATDSSEVNPYTLMAKTKCVVASTPLFLENFDNLNGEMMPDCWTYGWLDKPSGNDKPVPFSLNTNSAHSGIYAMSLVDQVNGSVSYLSTQCIPIDQAGKYSLSVWVYRQDAPSYPQEGLKFWVGPEYDDTVGATFLGYVPRHFGSAPVENTANEWYNYEYILNVTGNQYIIVEGISQYGSATLFDDLQVRLTPSCVKVKNITMGAPAATSANMTWTAGKNESQWIVNYTLTQGATVVRTVTDTVSNPSFTFSGLTQATTYGVSGTVKAYCGGTDVADPANFNFTFVTLCDAISTLPYTTGFESTELSAVQHALPYCWIRYSDAPNANYYPYAYNSTTSARTGAYCLNFCPTTSIYSDYGDNQVAILPEINTAANPMNTLRTVFYARLDQSYGNGVRVYVGAMTDPADLSTFVTVDSFAINGTDYMKCEAKFDQYAGQGRYMAIRVKRVNASNVNVYVDDVKIDPIPTCLDLGGAGVTISDVTATSVKLTLTDQTASADWSFAYGEAGTPLAQCTVVDTTGISVDLNWLQPQTSYVLYARRNCGTERGAWSDMVTFKTACDAVGVPFHDDFEDHDVDSLKGCYEVMQGSSYYLKVHSSASTASGNSQVNHTSGGSKGVCTSSPYTTPYDSYETYRALAYLHLEAGKNYEIALYAKAGSGYSGIDDWYLTFQCGPSITTLVDYGRNHINSTSWDRINAYFTVPTTGNYYVGFTTELGNMGYYYVFVDDITVDEVACVPPTSTTVTGLTSSAATVNLSSSSSSWIVAVSSEPIDITGTVTGDVMYDTISTPSFTVSGLDVNTEYYYTIRSICSQGGVSAWMKPSSFRTQCAAMNLPYTEDFEEIGSTLCWTAVGGTGTISRATVASTGQGSMQVSAAVASSPELNTTNLVPYSVTGWAYASTDSTRFSINVGLDPSDVSQFIQLQEVIVTPANTWVEFSCSFLALLNHPDYEDFANSRYVAFSTGTGSVAFDDVMIDITPTCPKPNAGTITNITAHTASIDWTESGTAAEWVVEAVPSAGGATVRMNTTSKPMTLTGLTAATSYNVYVRSVCDANDTSYKYKIGLFTTECDYVAAPYNETFEGFGPDIIPTCWDNSGSTTSTLYQTPAYVWGTHSANGNIAIRMNNYSTQSGVALINSPEIILDPAKEYQLRYDYSNRSSSGNMEVKIKRHSETTFTTIGQHPNDGTQDQNDPGTFATNSFSLANYAGDTIQIQIYSTANWGYGAMWVDNVKVRELSSCVEPATVAATNVGQNTATVNFTDTIPAHNTWQYAYGIKGFDVSTVTPITTTTKSISLTGLASSTAYDIYVRAVCSASDISPWVMASFKTTSVPAALPYYTDFSDNVQNGAWDSYGSGSNSFMFGTDANATFPMGTAAMYVANGGQYTYNSQASSTIAMARLFYFDAAQYNIEFDWKCSGGESSYDFARFYICPANVSPLPSGSGSFSFFTWPAGLIPLDGDQPVNQQAESQHVARILDFETRPGSYYLVFVWSNDNGGGNVTYPLSVSNISVSEVTCQPITSPKVFSQLTTFNTATATCTNPNPGAAVRYAVSTSTSIADTLYSAIAATDTFTFGGLSASTQYYLFLRSECSEGSVSPWIYKDFTTSCGVITMYPFVQDFETGTGTTLPTCWSNVTTGSAVNWSGNLVDGTWEREVYSWTHYGNGNAWARMTGSGGQYGVNGISALLVTPPMEFEAGREYHVSFSMYHYGNNYYTDQVDVYVGPNPSKVGAVKLGSLIAYDEEVPEYNDAVLTHDFDIPSTMVGNYYVMFEGIYNANGFLYLDDITVDRYPLCRNLTEDPTCVATTATTATVSVPMGDKTAVEFGIAPFSTSVKPTAITQTVVSTTGVATFTGLTAGTNYAVFARGICGEIEDTTAWTGSVKCVTKTDDCFAPDGLHSVGVISDTSATIAWNPVPDAQEYQYTMNGTTATVTTTQVSFDNLTATTQYTFVVRAVCGAGDTTVNSDPITFKTIGTPALIPYVTGFEPSDDNALWIRNTSAELNNFTFGSNSGGVYSGTQGLYISNNGSSYAQTVPTTSSYTYTDLYNITYASRTVYFAEAGNYDISFDWKCDAATNGIYSYYDAFGRAFLAPVDALLTADDPQYQRKAPAGAIVLGSDLDGSRYWQTSNSIVAVTEPCYKNVVFMWYAVNKNGYAGASEGTDWPLAIDNLSVTKVDCLPANTLSTTNVSDTYGSVVVDKAEAVGLDYAILTVNSKDSITEFNSLASTALIDTITFTGLTPSTQYYVFIRTVCDSTHLGQWRMVPLKTTGVPAALPYVCDFENVAENQQWQYALTGDNHFIIGSATSNGGARSIYVTSDNVSNTYNSSSETDVYASRIFYLTEGLYEYSYDWKAEGESTSDYGRIFMLPADIDIVDGIQFAGLSLSTVPSRAIAIDGGSYLNQKIDFQSVGDTFRITEAGSYNMVLYWRNDYYNGTNPPLAVDNVTLKAVTCLPPSARVLARATTETSITAVITNHNEGTPIVYCASMTGRFEDAVAIDTIPYSTGLDTVVLNGLTSSSNYYLMTRSICGPDDESLWNRVQFKTLCGTISAFPYTESFESLATTYTQGLIEEICWTALNDNSNYPSYHGTTGNNPVDGQKALMMHSSDSKDLYLALPAMNDINNLNVSFAMRSENTSNSTGIIYVGYMTDVEDASTFTSLLTTTRTTSWVSKSVVITGAPAGAHIAFKYGNATSSNYYSWLDNIRVSELVQGDTYYDTVCNNKPYTLHGFNQAASTMHVGDNTFNRVRSAVNVGEKDTLYTAHVYMRAKISATSYDTICAGQPYSKGLWNLPNPVSRKYTMTFQGVSACGCDSSVDLFLTVLPTSFVYQDTICNGDSYLFGDTTITDPGMYVRSYTSLLGCPTTDTLYLMVMPDSVFDVAEVCQVNMPYIWRGQSITTGGRHYLPIVGGHGCNQTAVLDLTVYQTDSTVFVAFCQGGSAQVADTIITEAGNYEVVRVNEHNCDVTYHITATVTAPAPQNVYDNACEGYLYTGYGINNLYVDADTIVVVNTKTIDAKCDSVGIVHLTYVKTVHTDTTAWIKEGDNITWHENTYSKAGDYDYTTQSKVTGCDSVVTLHLHVSGTGVENVALVNMNIVPNPVNAGQTSFVYGDFNGVKNVEILNSFGQVVMEFVPETYPIEVKGINASGIYYVRVTTDDDKVAVEKLIVK